MSNQEDLTPHKPSPTASDVSDHIGSFKEFFSHLNQAAKSALPTIPQRYNDVSVLLLRWEDDNLGTQTELNDLRDIFQGVYRYNVEQYLIPSNDPTLHLEDRLNDFRRAYGAEGNLLILYYGGHGSSEKNTRRSIWSPRETGNVSLVWSDLQGVLTRSNADVVFILDCCYAASASRGDRPSANEGLWASNSVATTTGVNDNSFTRNLIAELKLASADRLNVVMLHARLMRRFPKQLQTEPFYTYLGDNTLPSVEFSPIRAFEKGIKVSPYSIDPSVTEKLVLLAVRLKNVEEIPDRQTWKRWFVENAPEDVESTYALGRIQHRDLVKVEGYFLSDSALMLVSLPIFLWARLPDRPAYSFVDFIKAGNALVPSSLSQHVRSRFKNMTRWKAKTALE